MFILTNTGPADCFEVYGMPGWLIMQLMFKYIGNIHQKGGIKSGSMPLRKERLKRISSNRFMVCGKTEDVDQIGFHTLPRFGYEYVCVVYQLWIKIKWGKTSICVRDTPELASISKGRPAPISREGKTHSPSFKRQGLPIGLRSAVGRDSMG